MKFLANENFPFASIKYLKSKGFDVASIGMDFQGIKDEEVMAMASQQERTILTFDRDYGELVFKHNYRPPSGIIYLRIDEFNPDEPGMIIETLINNKEFITERALTVVDKKGIRQRKY